MGPPWGIEGCLWDPTGESQQGKCLDCWRATGSLGTVRPSPMMGSCSSACEVGPKG